MNYDPVEANLRRLSRGFLREREGNSSRVSRDPNGKGLTAGGHWLGDNSEYKIGDNIPQSLNDSWYQEDFSKALGNVRKVLPDFTTGNLTESQRLGLLSIAYQNGDISKAYPKASKLLAKGNLPGFSAEFQSGSVPGTRAKWLDDPAANRTLGDLALVTGDNAIQPNQPAIGKSRTSYSLPDINLGASSQLPSGRGKLAHVQLGGNNPIPTQAPVPAPIITQNSTSPISNGSPFKTSLLNMYFKKYAG